MGGVVHLRLIPLVHKTKPTSLVAVRTTFVDMTFRTRPLWTFMGVPCPPLLVEGIRTLPAGPRPTEAPCIASARSARFYNGFIVGFGCTEHNAVRTRKGGDT